MRPFAIAIVLAGIMTTAGCGGGGGGGGNSPWRSYSAPGMFGLSAVWAFAPNDVWVGGTQALAHFDGTAFTQVTTPLASVDVTDFWGFAPDNLYAASGSDVLHWDGAAWSVVDTMDAIDPVGLTSIWGTSGGDLWLGDSWNGQMLHWNGSAWSNETTQTVIVNDVWGEGGAPGGAVFAGGLSGVDRRSGSAWTETGGDVISAAVGLWGFSASDVWAVDDFGTLAHWDGAIWTDTFPIDDDTFEEGQQSIWGAAPGDVWAVGDAGEISHWDGTRWTQTQVGSFPYFPFLTKVHGSSASDVWVVGRNMNPNGLSGAVLHYEP